MGRFWNAATDQAGREFGARHYRWFAGARIARGVAPAVLTLIGAVGLVAAVVAGYRWLSPDWSAVGSRVASWGSAVGVGSLWVIAALVVVVILIVLFSSGRRRRWRLPLFSPMRMRRVRRRLRRF